MSRFDLDHSRGKFRGWLRSFTDNRVRDWLRAKSREKKNLAPVPAEELANAKRALVASFALSTESGSAALRNALTVKDYGFPADYWDTYPEKISAVTAEDIQRVARKYIPVDNLQIIAVGDATKIRDVLSKFGPIEEWDSDGHKK